MFSLLAIFMIRPIVRSNERKLLTKKSMSMMYRKKRDKSNAIYIAFLSVLTYDRKFLQALLAMQIIALRQVKFSKFCVNVSRRGHQYGFMGFLLAGKVTCSPEVCGASNEEGGTSALRLCSKNNLASFPERVCTVLFFGAEIQPKHLVFCYLGFLPGFSLVFCCLPHPMHSHS